MERLIQSLIGLSPVQATYFACLRGLLWWPFEVFNLLSFLSSQRTCGALIASHHWLPRIFAQANCTALLRLSMPTLQLGYWVVLPAVPCYVAWLQGALHPCSPLLCATLTRLSSPWMPRPQRYWLQLKTWHTCASGVVKLDPLNREMCILNVIRKIDDLVI